MDLIKTKNIQTVINEFTGKYVYVNHDQNASKFCNIEVYGKSLEIKFGFIKSIKIIYNKLKPRPNLILNNIISRFWNLKRFFLIFYKINKLYYQINFYKC